MLTPHLDFIKLIFCVLPYRLQICLINKVDCESYSAALLRCAPQDKFGTVFYAPTKLQSSFDIIKRKSFFTNSPFEKYMQSVMFNLDF